MTNVIDAVELAKHDSHASLWIAIDGKVYDVTKFVSEVRLLHLFIVHLFHNYSTLAVRKYCWSKLVAMRQPPSTMSDIRAMRAQCSKRTKLASSIR